jgi:hypothetical protein
MDYMIKQSSYYKFELPYTMGLPRPENRNIFGEMIGIYTPQEIEEAKKDPAFKQEYDLQFLGTVGTIFHSMYIQQATDTQYDPDHINPFGTRVMGIDPGFGSSPVGVCVLQLSNGKIQVIHAEDYERLASSDGKQTMGVNATI